MTNRLVTSLLRLCAPVCRADRWLAGRALGLVRLLTQMGGSPAAGQFWRMGALLSGLGAGIAMLFEAMHLALLLSLRAWHSPIGSGAILRQLVVVWRRSYPC